MNKKSCISQIIVCMILIASLGLTCVQNVDSMLETSPHRSPSPVYNLNRISGHETVPDCVEVGDLMLLDIASDESTQWKVPGPYNEHGGIYIGDNTLIDSGVASYPNGVHAYNYSFFYHYQKNFVFLRVKNANESQRQAAVAWAKSKIGTPYQFFYRPPWFGLKIANTNLPFPTADAFYCMEFLWAAYYNQGIDIDQNGWKFPWWVSGDDIFHDPDVEVIYRNVTNSTEIIKPFKGVYIGNKKIASTLEHSVIVGGITVEAVTYNENVTRIDFYVDNVFKSTDTSKPYQWTYSERVTGRKVIKAVSHDSEGNQYSATITVIKII
jgi:hypothetical protein